MLRLVIFVCGLVSVALAGGEEPRTPGELLTDLKSSSYQVRQKAVLECEGRGEPEILERLLAIARTDDHPNLRGYAAEVLATLSDPRIFDVLTHMVKVESVGVVQSAYVALGKHGDRRALPVLLAGLEAGRGTCGYAAKGLGLLGDTAAFEPLAKAYLANLEDPYLNDLGVTALFLLDAERARALLLPRFGSIAPAARHSLARALGEHPDPTVTKTMLEHLDAGDRELRAAALVVLRIARDPVAVPPLIAHLRTHPEEADATIDALGEIGDPRALGPLLGMLGKAGPPVTKLRTIRALARIGDRRAVSALIPCLDDPRPTPQPLEISSIWTFPYNSRVDAGAVWAIRTLLDGREPCEPAALSRFRDPVLPPAIAAEIPRIREWWKNLEMREPYTFTE